MTLFPTSSRLMYVDANTKPWPLNHHAYVHACAERLRKEVDHTPRVHFPESHLQRNDTRGALLRLDGPDHDDVLLAWDERRGWARLESSGRRPLVLGADPLLEPEAFTHAVTALLSPGTRQLVMVLDRSRVFAHPVDVVFERRLAAYRDL